MSRKTNRKGPLHDPLCSYSSHARDHGLGQAAEREFLDEVATEAYELVDFDAGDVGQGTGSVDRYADLPVGIADASLVVIAARFETLRPLTFDQRHFRTVAPLWGGPAFTLLPTDA